MSSNSEAGADGEQPLDFEQLPSPVPSSNSKTTFRDNVAIDNIDKPYSVYTYNEKWLIVCIASCAANFRRVGHALYSRSLTQLAQSFHCEHILPCDSRHLKRLSQKRRTHQSYCHDVHGHAGHMYASVLFPLVCNLPIAFGLNISSDVLGNTVRPLGT